jgi:hypothetical protein
MHVLQQHDNQIVGAATDLFAGIRLELEAQNKKITDNCLQIFAQKVSVQGVKKSLGVLSKTIDEVNNVLASITESMKTIPRKRELCQHQVAMDDTLVQIAEVDTGLTSAMEQYKFSESMPFEFRQAIMGPLGTQPYMNQEQAAAFRSPTVSSLRDMRS